MAGIEPASSAWKAEVLAVELHPRRPVGLDQPSDATPLESGCVATGVERIAAPQSSTGSDSERLMVLNGAMGLSCRRKRVTIACVALCAVVGLSACGGEK